MLGGVIETRCRKVRENFGRLGHQTCADESDVERSCVDLAGDQPAVPRYRADHLIASVKSPGIAQVEPVRSRRVAAQRQERVVRRLRDEQLDLVRVDRSLEHRIEHPQGPPGGEVVIHRKPHSAVP